MNIPTIKTGESEVFAKERSIFFKGVFDQIDSRIFLDTFFEKVTYQMEKEELDEIDIDLQEVVYLNSSVVGIIIDFLVNRPKGLRVKIIITKMNAWQIVSFKALKNFDNENLIIIEK